MSNDTTKAVKHPTWAIWTARLVMALLIISLIIVGGLFAHIARDLSVLGWNFYG